MPDGCQNCHDCPLWSRVEKLEEKYSTSRQRIYERLETIENNNARTDERYISIQKDLGDLKEEMSKISDKITELSNRPAKRWDNAVGSVISAVIGAIVGYISAKMSGGA